MSYMEETLFPFHISTLNVDLNTVKLEKKTTKLFSVQDSFCLLFMLLPTNDDDVHDMSTLLL